MNKSLIIAFTVFASLCCAAFTQPSMSLAQGDAEAFFKKKNKRAMQLMAQDPTPARSRAMEALLSELLDFPALAKASLATHWDSASETQRERFASLLEKLVRQSYTQNLETTASFKIKYLGAESKGADVLVRTRASSKTDRRAPKVTIDYLLRRSGKRWRVVDITTDGVSLVGNYRAQFSRLINRDGLDGLLAKMESKLKSAH